MFNSPGSSSSPSLAAVSTSLAETSLPAHAKERGTSPRATVLSAHSPTMLAAHCASVVPAHDTFFRLRAVPAGCLRAAPLVSLAVERRVSEPFVLSLPVLS